MSDTLFRAEAGGFDPPPGRWWDVAFFAAALAVAYALRPPFFTDWDSFDYTVAAMRGQPSTLATGRMFFTGVHALAWQVGHRAFGLRAEHAWALFQWVTLLAGGLGAVAVFRAGYHLTRSAWAAVLGGVLWITAPQAMLYAGAIMTETPAMLFFAASVVLVEMSARSGRGGRAAVLAASAGGVFALAANMREPLVCFGVYFAGRTLLAGGRPWRGRLANACLCAGGFAAVYAAGLGLAAWRLGSWQRFWGHLVAWRAYMVEERREVPNVVWRNLRMLLLFSASVSLPGLAWLAPGIVLAVRRALSRKAAAVAGAPVWGPTLWLLAGNVAYLASLLVNHDLSVNARFVLPLMMPVLVLGGAALADAVRRRSQPWAAVFLACGLASMLPVAVCMTWQVSGYLPARPDLATEVWSLLALAGLLAGVLMVAAIRRSAAGGEWRRLAAAGAAVGVMGAFVMVAAWSWLDWHYLRNSRWQKQFVEQITASAGLPDDAMLIPGPGTPALQYLINTGQHAGWILPGPPYSPEEVLAGAAATPGWIVIPSGWCWPDGEDRSGRGTERKVELIELVRRFHEVGRPVHIYGGPSSWRPDLYRNNEWPQIERLQRTYAIEETGPGDMCRVLTTQPDPGASIIPLGRRQVILERRRGSAGR